MRKPVHPRRHRRGNTATTIGLSLGVLVGFAALAIDFGYARSSDAQVQSVTDAASHAALQSLDGTLEGIDLARAAAVDIAAANLVDGRPVELDLNEDNDEDGDIVIGIFDPQDGTFSVFDEAEDDPADVNAVRVRGSQANLSTFFLPAVRSAPVGVSSRSTTALPDRGGAGVVNCFLPLALPRCVFDSTSPEDLLLMDLVLSPAGVDNAGWVGLGVHPSASWVDGLLEDCESAGPAKVGDPVELDNGVKTSAMRGMADEIDASATGWREDTWGTMPEQWSHSDVHNYGNTLERPIMVFEPDSGTDYCSGAGGPWNETGKIVGFAWAAVFDVKTNGNSGDKNFRLRVDLTEEYEEGTEGGGDDFGVTFGGTSTFVE